MAFFRFEWPAEHVEWKAKVDELTSNGVPYEQVNGIGATMIYTGEHIDELNAIRNPGSDSTPIAA